MLGVSLVVGVSAGGGVGVASVVVPGVSLGGVVVVVVVPLVVGSSAGVVDGPCACALGSWVESVVTSVTGGATGLATVGWGTVATALGAVAATFTTVLDTFFGTAILAFLARRCANLSPAPEPLP